jgi:hypothetical protein
MACNDIHLLFLFLGFGGERFVLGFAYGDLSFHLHVAAELTWPARSQSQKADPRQKVHISNGLRNLYVSPPRAKTIAETSLSLFFLVFVDLSDVRALSSPGSRRIGSTVEQTDLLSGLHDQRKQKRDLHDDPIDLVLY